MSVVLDLVAGVLILSGSAIALIGALGLIRMPDVFTRMHAAGMVDTLGATLLLAGMAIVAGWSLVTLKLLVLWLLFIFTSPVIGHALARAALYAGVRPILHDEAQLSSVPEAYGLSVRPRKDS
ncbi:MAG: monovalent cation/H(+) antiporter subunit G [Pseudomonadota bacterium]